ncbi:WecB/TagA/CpsF family glycosyltransferase [soil metagenome]
MMEITLENHKQTAPSDVIERVTLLNDIDEGIELIKSLLCTKREPVILSFINAHCYNLCCENPEFCNALLKSDVILRDGVGMKILYNSINKNPGFNFCGTDVIPRLLDSLADKRLVLLGTQEPYLSQAANKLNKQEKEIVLTEHGFHPMEYYVQATKDARPEVVLLGMGMPKQELVAEILKRELQYPCLIINGGAIIDMIAGKVPRAPKWIRNVGMEWAYRLLKEPKRLFKRYVIGNLLFLKRMRQLKNTFYK